MSIPAQAGSHAKSSKAERRLENICRFRSKEAYANSIKRERDRGNESNARQKRRQLTKETLRTNAVLYFGFAGGGEGFEEYVDRLLSLEEEWGGADAGHWRQETSWLMEDVFLNEALMESDSHGAYLYAVYGVETMNFHQRDRGMSFIDVADPMFFDDGYDDPYGYDYDAYADRRDAFYDYDPEPVHVADSEWGFSYESEEDDEPSWEDYLPDW